MSLWALVGGRVRGEARHLAVGRRGGASPPLWSAAQLHARNGGLLQWQCTAAATTPAAPRRTNDCGCQWCGAERGAERRTHRTCC